MRVHAAGCSRRAAPAGAPRAGPRAWRRRGAAQPAASAVMDAEDAGTAPADERGVVFDTAGAFYRRESMYGRDLAALTLRMHADERARAARCASARAEGGGDVPAPPVAGASGAHQTTSADGCGVVVLDALAGSGGRAARYLVHGGAAHVHANDASEAAAAACSSNLASIDPQGGRSTVTCGDAVKACHAHALAGTYFDLVDVDSFGSDSRFVGAALECVRHDGGLLYVTSTDGLAAGGHRTMRSWAMYGSFTRPVPSANEHQLRALTAHAVREAAARGLRARPLFSLYAAHGPVWRVMLRVERTRAGSLPCESEVGYASHCSACGEAGQVGMDALGAGYTGTCNACGAAGALTLSGPMWLGPMHDEAHVAELRRRALDCGWAKADGDVDQRRLARLIDSMAEECVEGIAHIASYYRVTNVLKGQGLRGTPSVSKLVRALRDAGHAACVSHVSTEAVKTTASVADIVKAAALLVGERE